MTTKTNTTAVLPVENEVRSYRAVIDFEKSPACIKCKCDNCDWTDTADNLNAVEIASLTPGHASPAGRCPECDSLAYVADDPTSRALRVLAELLPYATSRAEDMHAESGDECPHWQKADKAVSDAIAMLRGHGINYE